MKIKNIFILTLLFFMSCSKLSPQFTATAPAPVVTAEITECTTSTTYTLPVTVTGIAQFYKRGLAVSQAGSVVTQLILSDPIAAPLPIRFAEIRVLNSNGTVIQCGKTNSAGALKALDGSSDLQISNTPGTYTIEVLARSNQNMTVASGKPIFKSYVAVKEDIYSNTVYKISSTINSTGSGSFGTTLTATALESVSSKIEGGAFNIYNNLITTYDYFANLPDATIDFTCLNPKLNIFWKAGFNPALYIDPDTPPSNTISFYLRGENELYINGGVEGNVASADTDHFDDAVIIHEIGHHIENACGTMDSPGGSHNGRYRIDPRLAWSEGWGNFLAAHIIRNNLSSISPVTSGTLPNSEWLFYYDSDGYGATGSEYIRINIARAASQEALYDPVNPALYPGESHFRETSISRGLFKSVNTCLSPQTNCLGMNKIPFSDFWRALENRSAGTGMGKSSYPFRSSVQFISRLKAVQSGTLNSFVENLFTTDEALQPDGNAAFTVIGFKIWAPYGIALVPSGAPCNLKIQPAASGAPANNLGDQRYANHFYKINLSALPGVTTINISGAPGNVKMQLVQEDYQFNEGSLTSSAVSLSGLSTSQNYLLNIRLNSGAESTYTITDQNGDNLCPASSL